MREWKKKVDDRDRLISELKAQLAACGGVFTPLKIDTKCISSPGSSPVSAASYLRSFNPFGRG